MKAVLLLASALGVAALLPLGGCTGDPGASASPPDPGTDAAPDVVPIDDAGADGGPPPYDWKLPKGFPIPAVPADNPMTPAKVTLGRFLFYDTRLSGNQTQSCASCHEQERAFTDGLAQAVGSTGASHPRSSMSLANVAYTSTLTWANPLQLTLERQALLPMFGDAPVELGLASAEELTARLRAEPRYASLFSEAFPGGTDPFTLQHVVQALGSFQRTLISGRSPFDRFLYEGDASAISESAKRGYQLFNSEQFECFHCHNGFLLSDQGHWEGKAFFDMPFHNTGLYNVGGTGAYPEPNTGVEDVTSNPSDMGRFKAPSLRNVAVTAPYMHDGSVATLDEVLDHYTAGGRTILAGPNAGVGSTNPFKDPLVRPFATTVQERADVIEFLRSLTDDTFLTDPAFSNPWVNP